MPSNREFCISYSQNYVYKKSSASLERQVGQKPPSLSGWLGRIFQGVWWLIPAAEGCAAAQRLSV